MNKQWTAATLIAALQKLPADKTVMIDGCGCCYSEENGVKEYFDFAIIRSRSE